MLGSPGLQEEADSRSLSSPVQEVAGSEVVLADYNGGKGGHLRAGWTYWHMRLVHTDGCGNDSCFAAAAAAAAAGTIRILVVAATEVGLGGHTQPSEV